MRKIIALSTAAFLLSTVSVLASPTTIRLCTGEKGQAYQQAGVAIKSFAKNNRIIKIELVENTGGSSNNLARMTEGNTSDAGNCDAMIAQPNVLSDLAKKNRGTLSMIQQAGTLHTEYAQMVCSKDSGVKSVKSLASDAKKYSIALGQSGSGAWLTWQTMVDAEPRLKDVSVTPEESAIALTAVATNRTTCAMFPEGLRGRWMNAANLQYADKLRLVENDLSAFGKVSDFQNHQMYKFDKIPSKFYDKLQTGFFSSAVGTISWEAGVFINTDRVSDSSVVNELVQIIMRARPTINNALNVTK
jgi:TRAP-type uncharacterized transport system substrate-binding protein